MSKSLATYRISHDIAKIATGRTAIIHLTGRGALPKRIELNTSLTEPERRVPSGWGLLVVLAVTITNTIPSANANTMKCMLTSTALMNPVVSTPVVTPVQHSVPTLAQRESGELGKAMAQLERERSCWKHCVKPMMVQMEFRRQ